MPQHLTGPWSEFEDWIRETIGGDFEWTERPPDSVASRRMIANLIRAAMRRHDGVFPRQIYFLRRRQP